MSPLNEPGARKIREVWRAGIIFFGETNIPVHHGRGLSWPFTISGKSAFNEIPATARGDIDDTQSLLGILGIQAVHLRVDPGVP